MTKNTVEVDREFVQQAVAYIGSEGWPLADKLQAILDAPPAKTKAK